MELLLILFLNIGVIQKEEQIKKDIELLGWFINYQEINITEKEYPDEK